MYVSLWQWLIQTQPYICYPLMETHLSKYLSVVFYIATRYASVRMSALTFLCCEHQPSTSAPFLPPPFSISPNSFFARVATETMKRGDSGTAAFWAKACCLIALLIHINAAPCVPPNDLAPRFQPNPAPSYRVTLYSAKKKSPATAHPVFRIRLIYGKPESTRFDYQLKLRKIPDGRLYLFRKNVLSYDGNTIGFNTNILDVVAI